MADPGAPPSTLNPPGRQWPGLLLVVLSTIAIALVPSLAKLAYDGGSDTLTVISLRSVVSVAAMALMHLALRRSVAIPRRPRTIALAVGVVYGAMLYCYLGAVNYLPVNLVILIFFIHPLLVGLIAVAMGLERLTLRKLAALVAALAGLVLAVGLAPGGLDPIGLLLAGGAMLGAALVIVGNAMAMRDAPTLAALFYMMLAAAVVLLVPLVLVGTLSLPQTVVGWTGLLGVSVLATFGTVAFFLGMSIVGPTRAAMISNLEPVLGVAAAMAVLGERITAQQALGIALVIGAILSLETAARTTRGDG